MGVYIKGMEMPTSCWNCPVDKPLCTLWQGMTTDEMDNGRHKDCPFVPVPPHGRLIDADAFLALVNDSTILSDFLKCIISPLIRGEPTVIEAEEVNK